MGGTESILVVWQTESDTQGAVEFGLTESLGTRIESNEFKSTHSSSLTGLQANTFYYYWVFDGDRPLSKVVRLHTNHASNDTKFSFLVMGDSGNELAFFVSYLVNTSETSLGLHTGDVIYTFGEEQFYDSRFFYPYAQFLATNVIYMSMGNHDTLTDNGAPYLNNFYLPANNPENTERYYSFDYGHAHFVALDTNISTSPGRVQRTWLEQDLATNTLPWTFVFFPSSSLQRRILRRKERTGRVGTTFGTPESCSTIRTLWRRHCVFWPLTFLRAYISNPAESGRGPGTRT